MCTRLPGPALVINIAVCIKVSDSNCYFNFAKCYSVLNN